MKFFSSRKKKSRNFSEHLCQLKICPGFQKSHLEQRAMRLKTWKMPNPVFFSWNLRNPYTVTYTDPLVAMHTGSRPNPRYKQKCAESARTRWIGLSRLEIGWSEFFWWQNSSCRWGPGSGQNLSEVNPQAHLSEVNPTTKSGVTGVFWRKKQN